MKVLQKSIGKTYSIERIEEGENTELVEIHYLFYDEAIYNYLKK